jgi:hypothetical protein
MNLEIDGLAHVWPQGNQRRIEALEVSDLEHGAALCRSANHLIRFVERSRDRFFNEDVNAGFKQSARDFAVNFGWHGDAGGIDPADQVAPVRGPIGFSFAADRAGCFLVQIADGNEFRRAFGGERRVNSCVLPPETAGADDCCDCRRR